MSTRLTCLTLIALLSVTSVFAGSFVLTRGGKPAATIVLAAEPTSSAGFAAAELQSHVRKITGARLPVATDTEQVTGPRILVGESAATRALGLRSESFKDQEHCVRFRPNTLILMGRDPADARSASLPQSVAGKFDKALSFEGRQGLPVASLQFEHTCGTLEAWVWMPAQKPEKHGTILRLDGANPWTYHIIQRDANTSRLSYTTYDGAKGHGLASADLAAGWHHVLGTYDAAAGKMQLYVDGVKCGETAYVKTTCRNQVLHVGGISSSEGRPVGNPFIGIIDEVRVARDVRVPAGLPTAPYAADDNTLLLLHLDRPARHATESATGGDFAYPPCGIFQSNGTLNAVYDFLERYCGVRWYAPGDIGLVCPQTPDLIARGSDLQRAPGMIYRWIAGAQLYMPTPQEPVPPRDNHIWKLRMRLGGTPLTINHSFYGFYDTYLKEHPEWFAQGYPGRPPQMCFTNEAFIAQVVQNARDYFDGKPVKGGCAASGDVFGLVPMDNSSWCKCPRCQAELNEAELKNPQFNNGYASDYIYNFTNKVAREVAKSHPSKWIGQLAYSTYAYYPRKVKLEKNISVQLCLHTRNWWCPSMEANDRRVLADWTRPHDRPVYLWLYYCFPALNARSGSYNYWPGFFAHQVIEQLGLYHKAGICGMFLENSSECDATYLMDQLEYYLTFKLADDPTLDGKRLMDEFFTRYYGSAAAPMKALYLRIEDISCNPKYYPEEIQKSPGHQHQNEKLAWTWLGTPERVAELAKLMEQAHAQARTATEQQRVELFDKGIWQPIVAGRKRAETTAARRQQPPPTVELPRVPAAGGDPARVDWSQARLLEGWGSLAGEPTTRKLSGRIAHDGSFLYLQLSEAVEPKRLVSGGQVWDGDDFEAFFASKRGGAYHQLCVSPKGETMAVAHGTGKPAWESGVRVISQTQQPGQWTVSLALPLDTLLQEGRPAGRFYANFYRASPVARNLLAWTPTFATGFQNTDRLAEFVMK